MPSPRTAATGALLAMLVAFSAVSTDLYLPSLPSIGTYFGTDAGTVQLTLSLFFAGFAVAQLVYGPLSDRFGRIPVLYAGLVIYLLASIGCAFAQSIDQLIAGRFIQAVGACAGPVLARAMVRDLYGPELAPRVLSYLASVMGILPIVMPILGGFLTGEFGWRANFFVLATYAAIAIVWSLLLLRETNQWRDPQAAHPVALLRTYRSLLRNRRFLGYTIGLSLGFAGLTAYIANISIVLISYSGVAVEDFGWYFATGVVGFVSATVISGRITMRIGVDRVIPAGTFVMLLGGIALLAVALSGVRAGYAYVSAAMPFLIGIGFVFPNAMGAAIAPFHRQAGSASSMLGFIQMGLAGTTVFVVGVVTDGTPVAMAVTVVILTTASLAAFLLILRGAPAPDVPPDALASEAPSGR